MKPNEQNDLFHHIAAQYAEDYGARLKEQAAESAQTPIAGPQFEKKVQRRLAALRRRRYRPLFAAFAACLVLALLLPVFDRLWQSPAPTPLAPTQTWEIIPLSCTLPENLTLERVEQDNEKTVYYMRDIKLDDVVLTLKTQTEQASFSAYKAIRVNGKPVYGLSGRGYNLLTFVKDGVIYEATCKHDVNTLVALTEAIV